MQVLEFIICQISISKNLVLLMSVSWGVARLVPCKGAVHKAVEFVGKAGCLRFVHSCQVGQATNPSACSSTILTAPSCMSGGYPCHFSTLFTIYF